MFTRNYWIYTAAIFADKLSALEDAREKTLHLITTSGVADDNTSYYNPNTKYINKCVLYSPRYDRLSYVRNGAENLNGTVVDSTDVFLFSGYGIVFGSGNAPATIDDYKLSGDPISGITNSYTKESTFAENGSLGDISIVYTITNNNETDITIGEIGYFTENYVQMANGKMRHVAYLWERTALESPITIPAGGVGQVEYTIRMNYPVSVTTE